MVDTRALRALVRKGVGVRLSPAAQPGPIGKWHTVSMGRTERERGRPAASGSETAVVELHWAVSSVGRVLRWHRRGHQSESGTVHNSEFEERLTSPAPLERARTGISAKSRQGILNSAKSIPAESRRSNSFLQN